MGEGLLESAVDWAIGEGAADGIADYFLGSDDDNAGMSDFAGGGGGGESIEDLFGSLLGGGGGGGGASYGPSGGQLVDIANAGGQITPYLPNGAVGAATSIVNALLQDGMVGQAARELLARATGWFFGRTPGYQGGPISVAMVEMMMSNLSKDEVRALSWRAAGGEAPQPAASKKERDAFALLYIYDAMRALNAEDLATVVLDQTPRRRR